MKIEVLMSCIYLQDRSIIKKSNVQSDVLVINQCDENRFEEYVFENRLGVLCNARIIHTTERGLSKSRNMAIKNAKGDICLICDDDEFLYDNYVQNIKNTYLDYPKASLITFQIANRLGGKHGRKKPHRVLWISALRTASVQITFRRKSILKNNILFDTSLGAGVSKAGGEENLFLYDCIKKKLFIQYEPIYIANLLSNTSCKSSWFHGYNKEYLIDRGVSTRKIVGFWGAIVYAILWCLKNRSQLEYSFYKSFKFILKGVFSK